MKMKNPAHPGRIIKDGCLDALGLSVSDATEHLGVRRTMLSRLINGRSGIWCKDWYRLLVGRGSAAVGKGRCGDDGDSGDDSDCGSGVAAECTEHTDED